MFGNDGIHTYIEKYSSLKNTWSVTDVVYDHRSKFCLCAFMDKIFVIGGSSNSTHIVSCLQYNRKVKTFKEITKMKESRYFAACTVFKGKVVVAGGFDYNGSLKTVESYDDFSGNWSSMPNMINSQVYHSLVVVRNKLFVIGVMKCEVFDNIHKRFVAIRSEVFPFKNTAIAIKNKIVIVQDARSHLISYDVDKDEWSEIPCKVTEYIESISCVKIPCF